MADYEPPKRGWKNDRREYPEELPPEPSNQVMVFEVAIMGARTQAEAELMRGRLHTQGFELQLRDWAKKYCERYVAVPHGRAIVTTREL